MRLAVSCHDDHAASVATIVRGDRTSSAMFPRSLTDSGASFVPALIALRAAFPILSDQILPLIARLLPDALTVEIRSLVRRVVSPIFLRAQAAVLEAKRDYATRSAINCEAPASLPFAVEDRVEFRSLSLAEKVIWVAAADRTQLAALVSAGQSRFAELPSELWGAIVERHAILAHLDRTGLGANFKRKATASEPAAVGLDCEAAETASRASYEQFRKDGEIVDDAEAVLVSAIAALAVLTDQHPDEVFDLLTGQAQ